MDKDGTPFGRWGDHCPWCGADWKAPHDEDCQEYLRCQYPPGCDKPAALGRLLCKPHWDAIDALLGPVKGGGR